MEANATADGPFIVPAGGVFAMCLLTTHPLARPTMSVLCRLMGLGLFSLGQVLTCGSFFPKGEVMYPYSSGASLDCRQVRWMKSYSVAEKGNGDCL